MGILDLNRVGSHEVARQLGDIGYFTRSRMLT